MLQTAQAHRARLERLVVPAPKSWLCVVGLGRATRVGLGIARRADAPHFDLADATYVRGEGDSTSTATGDNTVPYLGARCSFIPTEQVVGVTVDDFGFWELQDRALLGSGLHAGLPNMNLVQRLVTSHLLERPSGELWGRRAPDLPAAAAWDPPIAGLREARA